MFGIYKIFLFVSLCSITSIPKVAGSGVFEIRLNSFENYRGVDSRGDCCQGEKSHNSDRCTSGQCSTYFMVCLKHYQAKLLPDNGDIDSNVVDRNPSSCTFGSFITPILGRNSFHGNNQIYTLPFSFSWPGTFSLILEAWNNNSLSSNNDEKLIARLATQRSANADSQWTEDVHLTTYTKMKYSYRIMCNRNYYGDKCANLCKPRDDKFGHYVCGQSGQKVCRQGWTGQYCSQAICSQNCHTEFGFCENPGECKCKLGYQGKYCDECIRFPGCSHGTCHKPWQCNCKEGWGGLFCNQDLNYCTNHKPCQNGATCFNTGQGSYTCNCAPGFHGKKCDKTLAECDESMCQNGGTCMASPDGNHTCLCLPGFNGQQCQINIFTCADNPCSNAGTCLDLANGAYKCLCPESYTGLACHLKIKRQIPRIKPSAFLASPKALAPPHTSNSHVSSINGNCAIDPCLNGGSCYENPRAPSSSFTCRCVPGFTGSLCQLDVPDCAPQPCANGATCIDLVNDYMCQCAPGFGGKDCTVDVDECALHSEGQELPCANNGTCVDGIAGYRCRCHLGYYGPRCEHTIGSEVEAVRAEAKSDLDLDSDLDRFEAVRVDNPNTMGNSAAILSAQPTNSAHVTDSGNPRVGLSRFLSNTEIIMVVCLSISFVTVTLAILGALFVYKRKLMANDNNPPKYDTSNRGKGRILNNNSSTLTKGTTSGLSKNPMLPTIAEDTAYYYEDCMTAKGHHGGPVSEGGKKRCTWEDESVGGEQGKRSIATCSSTNVHDSTNYSNKLNNSKTASYSEYSGSPYGQESMGPAYVTADLGSFGQNVSDDGYYSKSSTFKHQPVNANLLNQMSSSSSSNYVKKAMDLEGIYNEPKRLNTLPRIRAQFNDDTQVKNITDRLIDPEDDLRKSTLYHYDINMAPISDTNGEGVAVAAGAGINAKSPNACPTMSPDGYTVIHSPIKRSSDRHNSKQIATSTTPNTQQRFLPPTNSDDPDHTSIDSLATIV